MAEINGEIPPITSKSPEMGDFSGDKRKNFPYFPRNKLHSAFNRKISACFTFACFLD